MCIAVENFLNLTYTRGISTHFINFLMHKQANKPKTIPARIYLKSFFDAGGLAAAGVPVAT